MEHTGNADSFGLYKTPSLIKASRRIYTCHRLNYELCWTNNLHLLFWRSSSALKYFKAQTSSIDSIPKKFESCIPFLLSDSKLYFLKWSLLPAQQKLLACFYDLKSLRDDLIIKISYLAWKYYKYRRLGWHCKPICLAATSLPLVTSEMRTELVSWPFAFAFHLSSVCISLSALPYVCLRRQQPMLIFCPKNSQTLSLHSSLEDIEKIHFYDYQEITESWCLKKTQNFFNFSMQRGILFHIYKRSLFNFYSYLESTEDGEFRPS